MSSIKTTVFDGGTAIDFGNGVTATVHTPAAGTIALTLQTPVLYPVPTHTYQPAQPVADPDHVTIEMLPNKWSDVFAFYIECRKALAGATKSAEPESAAPVKVKRQRKPKAEPQPNVPPASVKIEPVGDCQQITFRKGEIALLSYNTIKPEGHGRYNDGSWECGISLEWTDPVGSYHCYPLGHEYDKNRPEINELPDGWRTVMQWYAQTFREHDSAIADRKAAWHGWEPREKNTCKSLKHARTLDDFAQFRDEIQVEFTAGYKNVSCLTAPKKLHCPRFDSDADRMDAIKNLVATHPDEFSANLVKESRKALIALEDARWQARYMAQCGEPIEWEHGKIPETPSYLTSTSKGMYMGIHIKYAPSHKGLDAIPA